jgi:hypothetical protein
VPTLKEILCSPENRPSVVKDAAQLVEDEVNSKGGISGIAIKAAFKAVRAVKPGLIQEVVDNLLERFIDKLEPFFTEWNNAGKKEPFGSYLANRKGQVANALLTVTDDRARSVQNPVLKKSYQTLRPQGEKQVEAAVPGLGTKLGKYVK